jgi:hypothetical protein
MAKRYSGMTIERNPAPRGGRRAPDRGGPLSSAEKFFYDHAGFSYDPKTETKEQGRRRVAKKLAAAEAKAEEKEWSVEWEHEQDPDISWMDEEQLADYENGRIEMLSATLYDAEGRVIGSLGGNALDGRSSSRNPQARVIEAELALEALGDAS